MKKILYFITMILLIYIFQPCNAMEQKPPYFAEASSFAKAKPVLSPVEGADTSKGRPTTLATINCIQQPHGGYFLSKKKIIVAGENRCSVIDIARNEELLKINDAKSSHLAVHPNGKLCALSDGKTTKIYDTKIGTLQRICQRRIRKNIDIVASIFEPLEGEIYLLYKNYYCITRHNLERNRNSTRTYSNQKWATSTITFHPTKKIRCQAENPGDISFDYFQSYDEPSTDAYPVPINVDHYNVFPSNHPFCQFSPDGSLLVSGDHNDFYICNKDGVLTDPSITPEDKRTLHEVIFHPNGEFIITLCQPGNVIDYWDINFDVLQNNYHKNTSLKPIITMSCSSSEDNPPVPHAHMCRYLSCDPNGTKLLVVLANQCLVLPVPFEIMYQPNTQDTCTFAYFALCNLYNQNDTLPQEIRHVIVRKLLKLHRRTNKHTKEHKKHHA